MRESFTIKVGTLLVTYDGYYEQDEEDPSYHHQRVQLVHVENTLTGADVALYNLDNKAEVILTCLDHFRSHRPL